MITTKGGWVMNGTEVVRRAAQVLRQAAGAASEGRWGVGNGVVLGVDVEQTSRGSFTCRYSIAEMDEDREAWLGHDLDPDEEIPASPESDASYIALVQPAVGSALARWLQDEADGCQTPDGEPTAHAVAVATLVLEIRAQSLRAELATA